MSLPVAQLVAAFLIALGGGLVTDPASSSTWPAFYIREPDAELDADEVVTVRDAPGDVKVSRRLDTVTRWQHAVQVRVRAKDPVAGRAKAVAIEVALEAVKYSTVTISAVTYTLIACEPTTGVLDLGTEPGSRRRSAFTLGFLVTVSE